MTCSKSNSCPLARCGSAHAELHMDSETRERTHAEAHSLTRTDTYTCTHTNTRTIHKHTHPHTHTTPSFLRRTHLSSIAGRAVDLRKPVRHVGRNHAIRCIGCRIGSRRAKLSKELGQVEGPCLRVTASVPAHQHQRLGGGIESANSRIPVGAIQMRADGRERRLGMSAPYSNPGEAASAAAAAAAAAVVVAVAAAALAASEFSAATCEAAAAA